MAGRLRDPWTPWCFCIWAFTILVSFIFAVLCCYTFSVSYPSFDCHSTAARSLAVLQPAWRTVCSTLCFARRNSIGFQKMTGSAFRKDSKRETGAVLSHAVRPSYSRHAPREIASCAVQAPISNSCMHTSSEVLALRRVAIFDGAAGSAFFAVFLFVLFVVRQPHPTSILLLASSMLHVSAVRRSSQSTT